jgi:hypothetical protein
LIALTLCRSSADDQNILKKIGSGDAHADHPQPACPTGQSLRTPDKAFCGDAVPPTGVASAGL